MLVTVTTVKAKMDIKPYRITRKVLLLRANKIRQSRKGTKKIYKTKAHNCRTIK